eukprot:s2934_g5.t1
MEHDRTYGIHSEAAPPPFVNENTDAADLAPDPSPAPGFIRLVKHQLTFILQRWGNEEDFQVVEHNMLKGSLRESRIEYFFHRLVGSWRQAQTLGNYWRTHYGLPELALDPIDEDEEPRNTGFPATATTPAAPVHYSLADISSLDPATVYAAQLLTTLKSFPQPATPQATRDQLTSLIQDSQLTSLLTPADLSILGDQIHQLASLLAEANAAATPTDLFVPRDRTLIYFRIAQLFHFNLAVVAMVQQLLLLTTALVAALGQTDVSTCGALFSTECAFQNDSAALLQVAFGPEAFPFKKKVSPEETRAKTSNDDSGGPFGPVWFKHQLLMGTMNDWTSSRDLARVLGVQNVAISPNLTLQIFSAVPVLGKDETYIVFLVEHDGDAWTLGQEGWANNFETFVMFCAGPDGSHKARVVARGNSWVCPWPREELKSKQLKVLLEDANGTNLGVVLAEHDPKLLGHLVGDLFGFRSTCLNVPRYLRIAYELQCGHSFDSIPSKTTH